MKIRVTMKDPDTMSDAVVEYAAALARPADLSPHEWSVVLQERIKRARAEISRRWMHYGEYLTVEFDLDAGTATVIENKDTD